MLRTQRRNADSDALSVIEKSINAANTKAASYNHLVMTFIDRCIIIQDLIAKDYNDISVDEEEALKLLAVVHNVPLSRLEDFRRGVREVAQPLQRNKEPPSTAPEGEQPSDSRQGLSAATAEDSDPVEHLRGRELWVTGQGENPAEFIRRVYKDVLKAGTLTRAQLGKVDWDLYKAYATWISPKRHPEDNLGLPLAGKRGFKTAEEALIHKRALTRASVQRHRKRNGSATIASCKSPSRSVTTKG